MVNIDQMPQIKNIVIWGEAIPADTTDPRVILWTDFMKLGSSPDVTDEMVFGRMQKQNPGNCCVLIYTSGTTGNPKGCMISHDNLCWNATATCNMLFSSRPDLCGPDNRSVSYLPLSHIAGLAFDVMMPMVFGSEVYFARPDALQGTLVESLQWARPTSFLAVPRVWEKFEDKLKEIAA